MTLFGHPKRALSGRGLVNDVRTRIELAEKVYVPDLTPIGN